MCSLVRHRELKLDTVAHLSTNRARRRLTSLIEANALTTTPDHQPTTPHWPVAKWYRLVTEATHVCEQLFKIVTVPKSFCARYMGRPDGPSHRPDPVIRRVGSSATWADLSLPPVTRHWPGTDGWGADVTATALHGPTWRSWWISVWV